MVRTLNKSSSVLCCTYSAVLCAYIVILAQTTLPLPSGVPMTLQTFAIAMSGFLSDRKVAVRAVGVYILLGCIGVPVYANFSSGISELFGITGGFLWGFFPMAICCSMVADRGMIWAAIGLFLCHLCGVMQFSFISGMSIISAAMVASVPYVIKDLLFVYLAYYVAGLARKRLSTGCYEHD